MTQISYSYIGCKNKLEINIPFSSGEKIIIADVIVDIDGDRCIAYTSYSLFLKRLIAFGVDTDFYIGKMQKAYEKIERGESIYNTMKYMITDHVNQFGRVIDTDLFLMASALSRVMKAKIGTCSYESFQEALNIAKEQFLDKLFITTYQMVGESFTNPSIVPASEHPEFLE